MWPRGRVEVQLYSSMTAALEGGEWSAARPGRTLPPGKTRYPLYRVWVGPRAGLDGCRKSHPHRNSIPYCPARSQSLYRLRYLAPCIDWYSQKTCQWRHERLTLNSKCTNAKQIKTKTKENRTHTLKEFNDNFFTCWIYVKCDPKYCTVK